MSEAFLLCMAGVAGFEPAPTVLETGMLAVDTIPLRKHYCIMNPLECKFKLLRIFKY